MWEEDGQMPEEAGTNPIVPCATEQIEFCLNSLLPHFPARRSIHNWGRPKCYPSLFICHPPWFKCHLLPKAFCISPSRRSLLDGYLYLATELNTFSCVQVLSYLLHIKGNFSLHSQPTHNPNGGVKNKIFSRFCNYFKYILQPKFSKVHGN